ncbi:MAG: hypothetical protein HY394_00585 [Candidatus Diapherotrites archaeon]|nr:hypothetical protein [Candidatus Diapherotrites archaeon]
MPAAVGVDSLKKSMFFVLLFFGVVVSGCLQTDSEKAAIELSASTVEGKLAKTLMESLKKTGECSVSDYAGVAGPANPLIRNMGFNVSLPTQETEAAELVENAKECNVQLLRNVLEVEKDKKYQVNYTAKVDSSCKYSGLKPVLSAYILTISVDLEEKTAVVEKGKLKDSIAQQVSEFQPAFMLMGKCAAPILLGIGFFGDFLGSDSGPGLDGGPDEGEKIAYGFDAFWDDSKQNPIQLSWNHAQSDGQYYVAIEMWATGNSSPLGSIETTIENLKDGPAFPLGHVFSYDLDGGEIYYGGQLSYPHEFKVDAYLLDSEYSIVEKFGYKEFSIGAPQQQEAPDAAGVVSNFVARWDAEDSQNPLKFTWDFVPQGGQYFVALDMWNTGNSSPLGSIEMTIERLKEGSPFPLGHVYAAEDGSGSLYWGGQYTYPDVFRIHAYLLDESYDLVGETAYVELTRNNADESPTSVPIG